MGFVLCPSLMTRLYDPSHHTLTVWHHTNKTGPLLKENMSGSQLYKRIPLETFVEMLMRATTLLRYQLI